MIFVGLSDRLRTSIEESICAEGGEVRPDCFDRLLALVIAVLERRHLRGFVDSPVYRKFINELLCQIQTGPYTAANGTSGSSGGAARKKSVFGRGRMKRSGNV